MEAYQAAVAIEALKAIATTLADIHERLSPPERPGGDTYLIPELLSPRARRTVEALRLHTVGDLQRLTEPEILANPNCGACTLRELQSIVQHVMGIPIGESSTSPAR